MSASHGYVFINQLVSDEWSKIASALVVTAGMAGFCLIAQRGLKRAAEPLIPDEKVTPRLVMEGLVGFVLKLSDDTMGKENRKYFPFVCALFIYLLFSNLFGLIPGFSAPTSDVVFNLGIALCVFILYNFWGIRAVGLGSYLKELWGPSLFAGVLLFPIELISHFFRPVTLSIRLFANMTADHAVLLVFTELTRPFIILPVPVIFYAFGTFVCGVQAFVFTLLTMIYIRLATSHHGPAHEHH